MYVKKKREMAEREYMSDERIMVNSSSTRDKNNRNQPIRLIYFFLLPLNFFAVTN